MRNTTFLTSLLMILPACALDDRDTDVTTLGGVSAGASDGDTEGEDGDDSGGGTTGDDDGDDPSGGGTSGGPNTTTDGGGTTTDGGGTTGGGGNTTGDPTTTGGGQGGPCGCGFPEWTCEPDFQGLEGTEGPMPPLCGGGSGLSNDPPNECHGGNFGSYSDVDSFCAYFVNRFRYLENECGNFNTVNLAIDPSLGSIAQAEADAVADGADPTGKVTCGGSPCGPMDGPMFNLASGASWLYIDGWDANGNIMKDSMFTAAESDMIIQNNPLWTDQMGNPIYERHCQYTTEFSNAIVYHYCNWDGMGVWGDPTTQPSRVGCGVAVDTNGITWRVVKLGE